MAKKEGIEVVSKQTEKVEKGAQTNRDTVVTSVSISKQFHDLSKAYNISPTDAVRKGIAVTLYELGIPGYDTELNKERAEFLKEYLKEMKEGEELKACEEVLTDALERIKGIKAKVQNEN